MLRISLVDHNEKNDKEVRRYDANGVGNGTLSNASIYGRFWKPLCTQHVIVEIGRQKIGTRDESEEYDNTTILGTENFKYYYSLNIGVEKASPPQLLNEATFVLQTLRHFTPLTMAHKSRSRPKGIPTATRATVSFFLEVGIDMI